MADGVAGHDGRVDASNSEVADYGARANSEVDAYFDDPQGLKASKGDADADDTGPPPRRPTWLPETG